MISPKWENLTRRWRTAWCLPIFLMATHLFLFIHDVLYARILYMLHKKCYRVVQKTMLYHKKIIHVEVCRAPKLWVTKNMLWQQKKLLDSQKRDPCWQNIFSVAQKRNTIWQKTVSVVCKCILYCLKKVFCRTKNTLMSCKN